jgi:hypothetical protein
MLQAIQTQRSAMRAEAKQMCTTSIRWGGFFVPSPDTPDEHAPYGSLTCAVA